VLQEFLGPEFRLFKEPEVRTVAELIAKHPEKKDDIVKSLGANVDVLVQKGTFNHSLVHTVIHNYLAVTEGKRRADCIESIRGELIHMLHSRDGAMAALHCLWHGTTKDRKAVIKSLKTFVEKTCYEEHGHMVLMAIFDTVDDTKLVGKAILGELAECFTKVMMDKYGLRVVKYLVAGRDSTYTLPAFVQLLQRGDGNQQSKKDPAVRRAELLEVVAPTALKWLAEQLQAGLYIPPVTITFTCLLNHLPASQQLSRIWALLAEEAAKPFIAGDTDTPNIVEATASNMLLKKVILKDKERLAAGQEMFAKVLMTTVDQAGVEAWLGCNRGCFLLLHCWETLAPEVQALVKEACAPHLGLLRRQKKLKGAEILMSKLG
jgi:pumilio family protein 6